jgi:glycerol-3-phosphate dehydrogenase
MRPLLETLSGRRFDVCIIGGGANGTSSAQHLTAAGYKVLMVEKGDYGSGSSSRSSRLLHCGLRYLAPGTSLFEYVRHPSRLRLALRMAKLSMEARRQMVLTTPERVREMNFHFPIWKESTYRPWQVGIGLKLLASMAPGDVPLNQRMLGPAAAGRIPLVKELRDWDHLQGVGAFSEYQLEWGERLCVDAALDAERMGAAVRNYTAATQLKRLDDGWEVELTDMPTAASTTVRATVILNMAGIWIDEVNGRSGAPRPRTVFGTKGCHIVVQLPPECARNGIVTFNSHDEPFYCIPWRGLHYFGPTETAYEGDLNKIRVEEEEIAFLLHEANHLLPSIRIQRSDVLSTWAGVRPLSFDPAFPKGKRSRDVHDLSSAGMPGAYAMTAGPLMSMRSGGLEIVDLLREKLKPSGESQPLSYAAPSYPQDAASAPVVADWPRARYSDLVFAARHEHATNLCDLMFGRVGAAWTKTMGYEAADQVAQTVAPIFGWDAARTAEETREYRDRLTRIYGLRRD